MPERPTPPLEPRDTVGRRLDQRFDGIDRRFEQIDRRFDAVDEHFREQREYIEFAYEQLRSEMTSGFARVEGRLDGLDRKLDSLIDHTLRPPRT